MPAPSGTFPDVPLGGQVDLDVGGWTPITSYVKQPFTISRGRADGQQQASAQSVPMTWNNRGAQFSPRNPAGPYYGLLGRNTPVRISVPAQSTYLRFADDASGSCATPSSAGLSVTGDLDVRIDLALTDWTPATLIGEWVVSSTGRSWLVTLESDGTIGFTWSPDGTTVLRAYSSIPAPLGRTGLRVTLAAATGTVTWYTAPDISGSWAQYGNPVVAGATSIYASSSPVTIGYIPLPTAGFAGCLGRVYAAQILAGIGGTTVASPDFTAATAGGASLTDAQGNIWALTGTAEFSNRSYRFHGECSALPQTSDVTGNDIWTPVTAAGLLRRLGSASAPVVSAMRRAITSQSGQLAPVAYWPAEDAAGATQIGQAIGPNPMLISGTPSFAADSSFACSNPLPTLNGSSWTGRVGAYTSHGSLIVRFLLHVPASSSAPDEAVICRVNGSGTVREFTLRYRTGGSLEVSGWDSDGNNLFDSGAAPFGAEGKLLWVSMELQPLGGQILYSITVMQPGSSDGSGYGGTLPGTVGDAAVIAINPGGTLTDVAAGHISVQSAWSSLFALSQPFDAWIGETAGNRFARLCGENGVASRIYGPPDASVPLGAQTPDTLVTLLQQCEDADQGMIYEARDALALGYRTSGALCAQSPGVTFDFAQDHLGGVPLPTDDDQFTRNDVVLSRTGGSTVQVTQQDGPMSILAPPDGAGDYQYQQTVSLATDAQLGDVAGWYLHMGTVDEQRWPLIPVDLANRSLAAMFFAIQETELGDYVAIQNPPPWLPPDQVKAIVWGYSETIGEKVFEIDWQTQPESPYEVLIAG